MQQRELLVVDKMTDSGLAVARKPLIVTKIGGDQLNQAADVIARIHHDKKHDLVVVHGGGDQISERQKAVGIQTRKLPDGNRVTDKATREIVVEVMDETNASLVGALSDLDVPVIGYHSGTGLIEGKPISSDNLTAKESSLKVDGERLKSDLYEDEIAVMPVIAPIAQSSEHGLLNVNGDSAAGVIAKSLDAKIVFVTGVGGVKSGENILPELDREGFERRTATGEIHGGMKVKVWNALDRGGVIVDLLNLPLAINGHPVGTRIR